MFFLFVNLAVSNSLPVFVNLSVSNSLSLFVHSSVCQTIFNLKSPVMTCASCRKKLDERETIFDQKSLSSFCQNFLCLKKRFLVGIFIIIIVIIVSSRKKVF